MRELNFKNEAENLGIVGANLRNASIDVVVPRCHKALISDCCFVMEYCEGFKVITLIRLLKANSQQVTDLSELERHNIDKLALVRRICQAYAQQVIQSGAHCVTRCKVYIDGVFNADPHAGNILVSVARGRVQPVLLDFGMTRVGSLYRSIY